MLGSVVRRCAGAAVPKVATAVRPGIRALASAPAVLKKTALHDLHVKLGGKMVEFAGYAMPVQYPDGIIASHNHCRSAAALFDVSHMGQLTLNGKDRVAFLESLSVGDFASLPEGSGRLSMFTNEQGGVLDDFIATNAGGYLFVVVNAGCKDADIAHMQAHAAKWRAQGKDVSLTVIEDRSLVALQGPEAGAVLQRLVKEDLSRMSFMTSREMAVDGIPCRVTRCGYTGEDGFEISVPSAKAVAFFERLCAEKEVKPAGLGPRDSLRLEAGLCLYGHELSPTISPVEAGLTWAIGKRRREQGGFLGAAVIQKQIAEGVTRKRVGLLIEGAPAREHTPVFDASGKQVGEVTSGGFSPTLKRAIAQAYVATPLSKDGTALQVEVRGKRSPAVVAKMPMVKTTYYKAP
eukprot:tig00000350_g24308.t1